MLKQRLKSLHGQSLLDCYLWEYSQFTNTAQIIHYIFRYLNRHWIRRQIDEGWLVYDIYTPHLVRWHSIIFQDISCDLVSAISELVEKHNDGQVIEHGDGKDLIEFIVSLALDATNPPYGSILEIPLRKSIMAASENNRLLEFFYEDSVPNYDDESARTEMEDQLVALTLGSQARARARNNDGMVKLVTSDLAVVEVEQKSAECSFIIKHLCAYFGRDIIDREFITLPNVDEAILRKILKWCDYHKDDADSSLVNRNTDTPIDIDEWDRSYMQVDQKTLFKIVLAANFLDIEALVALGCQTIAELINGRSSDEIRKTFGLPNDFTPEEEEQLRREAAWTEESEETYLPTLPRRVAH
ncbi:Skp1-domain-containing protein [Nemania sp. NC0429]|nr:Skp1-domain-containing protein [Nemania sp. NC0429]